MLKWLLIAALPALLSGCLFTPEVESTSAADAQKLVDSLTYAKAKNGVCFGVGTISRVSTNGTAAENMVLAYVPCEAVGL